MTFYDTPVHMMQAMGGSFVSHLAECWFCADAWNRQRLSAAFPEIFERYLKMWQEQEALRPKGESK